MFPPLVTQDNNAAGVQVSPRDPSHAQPRTTSSIPVTLYFIGVKLMRPHLREIETEGEWEEIGADGIKRTKRGLVKKTIVEAFSPPIINVRGRAMNMPPIGTPITVPKIVADELIRDGQWPDAKNNKIYPGFTSSAVEARAVKRLWQEACDRDLTTAQSCLDGTKYETAVATEHLDSMSDEQLLAQLAARRGIDPSILAQLFSDEEIDVPEADSDEDGDSEGKPKRRGRPPKTDS